MICTRLVRHPRHSGRHAVDLLSFVRFRTVPTGWRYGLMQTAAQLVGFFEKQGFASTGLWTEDACGGRLQTMLIDTHDEPVRLRKPRSAASQEARP